MTRFLCFPLPMQAAPSARVSGKLMGQAVKPIRRMDSQALSQKGTATRGALIDAARQLMYCVSPLQITVSAICKKAQTGVGTFYRYFNGVEDILWTLCDLVTDDTTHLFDDDMLLRIPERLDEDALILVKGYSGIWNKHSVILSYRNLEADRGNTRFNLLLTRTGLPIVQRLTERIVGGAPSGRPIRHRDATAEAVVILAAMDRLCTAALLYPEISAMPDLLHAALARMICRAIRQQ